MEKTPSTKRIAFVLAAVSMGLVNGLFGAGGGMLAVVALERFIKLPTRQAHATALMIMLPLSIISLAVYFFRGALVFDHALLVIAGMLPGSFLGAKLLGRLKSKWVNRFFCMLMLFAGIRLVVL